MKLLYRNNAHKIALVMLYVCVGQFLVSCSKENGVERLGSGDGTKLIVKVLGIIEDDGIASAGLKASAAIKSAVKESDVIPSKMMSFESFDALVSVERDVLTKSKVSIGNGVKGSSANGDLMAAAIAESALAEGVKYRLLLYKKNDGTFESSTLLTSSTAGQEVSVTAGETYTWYAVSYNNTDDVPDVMNPSNPTLDLPGDKDVLYASGEIEIPVVISEEEDTNVPLGIRFKHQLARIGVEINTMGMFADMESVDVEVSGVVVKNATLNLKSGALSNFVDYTATIESEDFVDVEAPYKDRKAAYIYTANSTALSPLMVTVKGLVLKLDDGTSRDFGTLSSVFNFSSITPQLGASYTAKVNLLESPLTLDGVKWARQNLYYTGGHNPYRFHHTYAHTNQTNSYFPFGAKYTPSGSAKGDPCTDVYPQGVWRQPTSSEFLGVTGVLGLGGENETYGSTNSRGYFEYRAASGTAAPYPSNNLRFNMNGEATTLGLVNNLIEIQIGQYGNQVELWSSTPLLGLDLLGLEVSVGAYHYSGTRTTLLGIPIITIGTLNSLLNVDLIGLDVAGISLKNVRCVRN